MTIANTACEVVQVDVGVYRVPTPPVTTSFGVMRDRPAVFVRLTERDGTTGWGEVWCNFPSVGAEHRARLLATQFAPLLCAQPWESPQAAFAALSAATRILAIQAGEPGPLAQAIAAIDIALWDIVGKRAGQPLWRLFGGSDTVRVYASGINPDAPERTAQAMAEAGHQAFKLKIGFGAERDLRNLRAMREALGDAATLMADANQAWDVAEAVAMAARLAEFDLAWLEEPLAADAPPAQWRELAERAPMPLAAGENLRGADAFREAGEAGGVHVIQPDIGKWGGFSAVLPVGREAQTAGRWYCPHWLGGGVGLTASLHAKAAVGGPGYVEIDANPNPLRDLLLPEGFEVRGGHASLPDTPGLGVDPARADIAAFCVATHTYPTA